MVCKLCCKENELRNSHIIPEFFYVHLYDAKHRAQCMSSTGSKQDYKRRRPIQKGYREKLLCDDCEKLLNTRYENDYKKLWFDKDILPQTLIEGEQIILEGLDYHKFKQFHLSILFRASVSSLSEFQHVNLGPHEEELRKILIHDLPTSDQKYVILCHAITKNNLEIQYGLITSPFKTRQPNGYLSYGFCFGGCVWYYIVDSREVSDFSQFMLNSQGTLHIMSIPWEKFLRI